MAILPAQDRFRVFAQYMREGFAVLGRTDFSKPELSAAVDAAAQWVDDNRASFNNALPAGFRTKATNLQKAFLLFSVVAREVGRYRAREDE
jgi:hypothetical protein